MRDVTGPPQIIVWVIDLLRPLDVRGADFLSEEERVRAERFHFPEHRRRFIVRRAAYRSILARWCDLDPAELRFVENAHGKPAIANQLENNKQTPRFNTSHSHEVALIALCQSCDIGIDIERIRSGVRDNGLVERIMTRAEQDHLASLPEADRDAMFFTIWSRKEALVKAWGVGLAVELDTLNIVANDGSRCFCLSPDRATKWWFHDIDVRDGYKSCLAAPCDEVRISVENWSG